MCSGDVTALAELGTELLGEGLCAGAAANPGMVMDAIENVIDVYRGLKSFRKNAKSFAQFSQALAKQLNSQGDKTDGGGDYGVSRTYLQHVYGVRPGWERGSVLGGIRVLLQPGGCDEEHGGNNVLPGGH